MRSRLALLALLAVVVGGCGGGGKTTKSGASHVDFVGQVFLVYRDEPDATWFMIYADPTQLAGKTLVKYPVKDFRVGENDFVHVVGDVATDLATPDMMMWDAADPVVLASEATVVPQPAG